MTLISLITYHIHTKYLYTKHVIFSINNMFVVKKISEVVIFLGQIN